MQSLTFDVCWAPLPVLVDVRMRLGWNGGSIDSAGTSASEEGKKERWEENGPKNEDEYMLAREAGKRPKEAVCMLKGDSSSGGALEAKRVGAWVGQLRNSRCCAHGILHKPGRGF